MIDQSGEKPDFGFFTRGQISICVRSSFSFHAPAFEEGKTGPDTQAIINFKSYKILQEERVYFLLYLVIARSYPASFSGPRFILYIPMHATWFKHCQVVVRSLIGEKELAIKAKIVCDKDFNRWAVDGFRGRGWDDNTGTTNTSRTNFAWNWTSLSRIWISVWGTWFV